MEKCFSSQYINKKKYLKMFQASHYEKKKERKERKKE
jgi:hypothetical protein